jgi:hypothetical protein
MRFSCLIPLLLQFILLSIPSISQTLSQAEKVALTAPDSAEQQIGLLSDYFKANLNKKNDLLRAFYVWTAHEISYDVANMYNPQPVVNRGALINKVLKERKAVCQGYCEVFHELCRNTGIESYLIHGYTRQYGEIMPLSHTWVLARPDTGWFFFDPTWGSGYVNNGEFTSRFNNDWYLVAPADMIKSHMPFDPLWQCLHYPWTSSDFYNNLKPEKDPLRYFAYADSIILYQASGIKEQYESTLRRVEANGVVNSNTGEFVRLLRHNIEIEKNNKEVLLRNDLAYRFNDAVAEFNKATLLFNDYVNYWNKQFKPLLPDDQIRRMMDTCINTLARSETMLSEISPREETLQQNKTMLMKSLLQLKQQLSSHQAFLREYFATPKSSRPKLFYTYKF